MRITLMFPNSLPRREPEDVQLSRVPIVNEYILNGEVYYDVKMVTHLVNPGRGDPVAIVAVHGGY